MDCPECGAHNPDDAQFCSLCYSRFTGEKFDADSMTEGTRDIADLPGVDVAGGGAEDVTDVLNVEVPAGPGTNVDAEIPGFEPESLKSAGAGEAVESAAAAMPQAGAAVKAEPKGQDAPKGGAVEAAAIRAKPDAGHEPEGADGGDDGGEAPPLTDLPPGAFVPPRKASGAGRRWLIISLVVVALSVFGLFLIMLLTRGNTYQTQMGTMTFTYPKGWQQVEPGELPEIMGLNLSTLQSQSELTVKAGGTKSGGPTYVVSLETRPNDFTGNWDSVKSRFKARFVTSLSTSLSGSTSGITFSKPTYKDIKVGEDPAYSMKVQMKGPGGNAVLEQVLLVHEETAYIFTFFTRTPEGSTDTSSKILKTVKFEIVKPVTEEQK